MLAPIVTCCPMRVAALREERERERERGGRGTVRRENFPVGESRARIPGLSRGCASLGDLIVGGLTRGRARVIARAGRGWETRVRGRADVDVPRGVDHASLLNVAERAQANRAEIPLSTDPCHTEHWSATSVSPTRVALGAIQASPATLGTLLPSVIS